MMYRLHEWQNAAAMPFRLVFEAGQQALRHPFAPAGWAPAAEAMTLARDVFDLSTRRHRKPGFDLDAVNIDGAEVAVREVAVARTPFCTLLHFDCARPAPAPKVLLLAPIAGHFAGQLRDMVAALLSDHDVFVTDWIDAREVPLSDGRFDLETYIEYVQDFLRLLAPDLHVLAVCQGTIGVLSATALMAADHDPAVPRSMILFGGPIDTRINPTLIDDMATSHPLDWLEQTQIATVPAPYPGQGRRVHPGFIQRATFLAANVDRLAGVNMRFLDSRLRGDGDGAEAGQRVYEEYLSVMDLPAEFYLQTVKVIFQEHALARGTMTWRGHRVDPAAIRDTALMTVEAERDDVTGAGQTHAAHALCPNIPDAKRMHTVAAGADHIDLFSGPHCVETILPQVRDFIRTRAAEQDGGSPADD